ncbi:DUF5424 family protein, partial [Rickettsia sp. TH2014]
FDTYTPNSTSHAIEDYHLIGNNVQLIAVEV